MKGRSVLLGPETKALITRIFLQDTKQKAPEVRLKVWKITHQENPALPQDWPSLSSIQKQLAEIRRNMETPGREDMPWTLDTLRDNPLLPEVLPKLFPIWLKKQEDPLSPPLSIREAKWIAQLSGMTDDIELLRIMAEMCAEWELIGELTRTPQLSSPVMVLHIYSLLIRMAEKELKEHYQEILREKHASGTRREETIQGLGATYGDEFLKAMKLKSKKKGKKESVI